VDKELKYGEGQIYYQLEGEGEPVMLLHGFAEDHTIWYHQVKYLQNIFRLIIPDIPGSGRSDSLQKSLGMKEIPTMDDYATAMKAIADAEGIEQFSIIGHSMGGYISLAFAEKYPSRIKQLGLFHSTGFPDTEEKKIARRKSNEIIRQYGSRAFLEQSIPNLFDEEFKKEKPAEVEDLIGRYANFEPDQLVSYYETMIARPDRREVLRNWERPVLFIIGEHDKAVTMEQNLKEVHLPQCSYIHILENTAHMGMLERPGQSSQLVENFLTKTNH